MELRTGDSVVVKSGIFDPDFGVDISGWQGRIEETDDGKTIFIRWDSITLEQMPLDMIIRCENENLDWELMTLDIDEIVLTTDRDSKANVSRMVALLILKINVLSTKIEIF